MQAYYNILTNLKAKLEADEFVNTVTQGDIFDIDLTKQTIFPLAHIIVNDVTKVKNILQFNVTVMCMDIVDLSKDETTDIFLGNDNEQDVLNTQLAVGLRLVELLESGSSNTQFMMRGEPTFEGFTERFENNIAGWAVTFDIHVPNTMTSCDDTATGVVCYPANYIVEYANGTLIESGTIASGGSVTVTVPNCPDIDDATWTLTDTNGNTLDTGTIASGGTATIVAPDATININGSLWGTVESGGTENIIVRQSTGSTQVGSKQGQYYRISDCNIQNSDGSYDLDVKAENSIVLPDSQINVNTVNEGSVVSVADVDINLTDSGGTVTPDSVTITGNTVAVVLPDAVASVVGAKILKTAQTTSFATGDDGDLQEGRDVDFFTLNYTNPFGNTNRFTDEFGGATYANDIVIDWSTYDGAEVLGYYRIRQGGNVWSDAVANALALSVSTFTSGWRLTNFKELLNLYKIGNRAMNYSPINQGAGNNRYWTSTTLTGYTNQPYFGANSWQGGSVLATNPYEWLGCRNFTVTGTTLT
jgi:hypothetical protein